MDSKTPGEIINELARGKFAKLGKIAPAGSLEARKLTGGTALYWRVTIGGKTERVNIGFYDSSAPPKSLKPTAKGYSIRAAVRAAEVLAQRHHDNLDAGGHRGLVEADVQAKRIASEAEAEAQRKAEAVKLAAAKYTLDNLLTAYCEYLKTLGRRSHGDARSIFKIHVTQAWPKIAALPANQVTSEQVADMMRKVLESGKGRTANKLRSYLRAAYQVALAARSKASIPLHFKDYRITSNPGADTVPDESQNNPDKNPLSADELRAYWQIIKPMPGFGGAVLRLHLLTGGQRIEQLVNLKTADVTADAITLFDAKGRPGKAPRPHTVPLIPLAATALRECSPEGVYALSTDKGETHLAATTLSNWARDAAGEIPGFATKRVRSGVETLLASARISTEIRGRLQSHGITGVQARHYDGHDYMDEKRHALKTLSNLLNAPNNASNVRQLKVA
jgi:integrase